MENPWKIHTCYACVPLPHRIRFRKFIYRRAYVEIIWYLNANGWGVTKLPTSQPNLFINCQVFLSWHRADGSIRAKVNPKTLSMRKWIKKWKLLFLHSYKVFEADFSSVNIKKITSGFSLSPSNSTKMILFADNPFVDFINGKHSYMKNPQNKTW